MFDLSEDRTQRDLCHFGGGVVVVLDGDDGLHRVGDVEVGDGVYWDGDAVLGDHVLGFDVDCDGLQVDFHHPIDERDDEKQARPFWAFQLAETNDDTAFVFADASHRGSIDSRRDG